MRGQNARLRRSLTECTTAAATAAALRRKAEEDVRARDAIIASLNVKIEDARVDLRSRPTVPGVVGRTLATSCVVGLAVAGARYAVAETLDLWLVVVSGAQCVGAGVALSWGE